MVAGHAFVNHVQIGDGAGTPSKQRTRTLGPLLRVPVPLIPLSACHTSLSRGSR